MEGPFFMYELRKGPIKSTIIAILSEGFLCFLGNSAGKSFYQHVSSVFFPIKADAFVYLSEVRLFYRFFQFVFFR